MQSKQTHRLLSSKPLVVNAQTSLPTEHIENGNRICSSSA